MLLTSSLRTNPRRSRRRRSVCNVLLLLLLVRDLSEVRLHVAEPGHERLLLEFETRELLLDRHLFGNEFVRARRV